MSLINNEDIIGEVTAHKDYTEINKPAIIVMMQGQNGQPNLGMADYLVFADETKKAIAIQLSKILFQYIPSPDIKNAYSQKFGSGLVLATSQPSFDLDKLLRK